MPQLALRFAGSQAIAQNNPAANRWNIKPAETNKKKQLKLTEVTTLELFNRQHHPAAALCYNGSRRVARPKLVALEALHQALGERRAAPSATCRFSLDMDFSKMSPDPALRPFLRCFLLASLKIWARETKDFNLTSSKPWHFGLPYK